MWVLWLIAAGVFFVVEMATVGFLVFWLGIGALLAMITSFITSNLAIQFAVFLISSTLLIIFTKPLVNKFVKIPNEVKTNAYSIIGKKAIVIAPINNIEGTGQIKIDGDVWSAKSYNEENIPKNSEVEIVEIDGVRAVVKLSSDVKSEATATM